MGWKATGPFKTCHLRLNTRCVASLIKRTTGAAGRGGSTERGGDVQCALPQKNCNIDRTLPAPGVDLRVQPGSPPVQTRLRENLLSVAGRQFRRTCFWAIIERHVLVGNNGDARVVADSIAQTTLSERLKAENIRVQQTLSETQQRALRDKVQHAYLTHTHAQ